MKLITILGPTATGKTKLAAHLAYQINGEIISADSRQVFRHMNIGTGKDYSDYIVKGKTIPYHLIDIAEPGEEFSVFDFRKNFVNAFKHIASNKKTAILCGGTGLYIESVLKNYNLSEVPKNIELRKELSNKSISELTKILSGFKSLHNTTDTVNKERLLRAIEIEYFQKENVTNMQLPTFDSYVFGINYERTIVMERITTRLKERLQSGMIEEVESLIKKGVSAQRLKSYGLEYKFITQFLLNEISYNEMFRLLNIAIHQFSKRQMTWFRRMEKNGIKISWINGNLPLEEKTQIIVELINC
ncbi:MAG: tRNA (adenosine(37)-N6)-dimethylallyltransferase MiaA [Bacteroidales bacterium]|jgi:tRNA dimethylallyltransferase